KCICPTNTEDLIFIPKSVCGCVDKDLRDSCKTCPGGKDDDKDCISPTEPKLLQDFSRKQCDCLPTGDLREECIPVNCVVGEKKPTEGCICTAESHPDDCICPDKPSYLIGISKYQCKCIDMMDLRESCQECTGEEYDDSDCICPTTAEGLFNIDTQKCPCLEKGDLRGQCYTCTIDILLDGCICPLKAEQLQDIPKKTCVCLPIGDLRNECIPITCQDEFTKPTEGCFCNNDFHPENCFCPSDANELKSIDKKYCKCLPEGDLREECAPAKCESEYETPSEGCFCDSQFHPYGCTCPETAEELKDGIS
ncbi:MAG: hypothetical protein EZS28_050489, partial [Streblomastix strix]